MGLWTLSKVIGRPPLCCTLHMYDTYGDFSCRRFRTCAWQQSPRTRHPVAWRSPVQDRTADDSHLDLRTCLHPRAILINPAHDSAHLKHNHKIERTTVRFGQVGKLSKHAAVPEGDVDDAVVRERRECVDDGRFLPTTRRTGGDEHARELAYQGTRGPKLTRSVPE